MFLKLKWRQQEKGIAILTGVDTFTQLSLRDLLIHLVVVMYVSLGQNRSNRFDRFCHGICGATMTSRKSEKKCAPWVAGKNVFENQFGKKV